MLHISRKEQASACRRAWTSPKPLEVQPGDLNDRKLWNEYMAAYETMLTRCSTS